MSVIHVLKVNIKKICSTDSNDVTITAIKEYILSKLNHRFPETEAVQFYQLLDPATKDLIPRAEATEILEHHVQNAVKAGFISTVSATTTTTVNNSTQDKELDIMNMKTICIRMEMVNELKSHLPSHSSLVISVYNIHPLIMLSANTISLFNFHTNLVNISCNHIYQ